MTSPIVALTGGLGNQLFQIAKAISASKDNHVKLDLRTSGSYRVRRSEILDLEIPKELEYSEYKYSPILRFFFARIISKSSRGNFTDRVESLCYRIVFEKLFTFINGTKIKVFKNYGIGYYHSIQENENCFLIGYFQSHKWIEDSKVRTILHGIKPAKESSDFNSALAQIIAQNAIAIHVRLGDYFQEDKFGILDAEYYRNALEEVDPAWKKRHIWIFSNDVEVAGVMLANIVDEVKSVTWVGEVGNSSVYPWQLMRHAKDFIIGNSTYSWWAAALRFDTSGSICAPNPWFKDMPTPLELIPNVWKKVDAKFVVTKSSAKVQGGENE